MYTAFARNMVMGADPAWTRELFGFALVPDLVLYLEIDVEHLVPRVLEGKGMDYWESGMHLALGTDIFDSFQRYQRRLIEEYNALAREFGFVSRRRAPARRRRSRPTCASTSPRTSAARRGGRRHASRRRGSRHPDPAGADVPAVLRAARPAGLVLSADDPVGLAARAVVRFHLRAFAREEGQARAGEVEPVHQLRVATRRLRAALRVFAPVLPPTFVGRARREIGVGRERDRRGPRHRRARRAGARAGEAPRPGPAELARTARRRHSRAASGGPRGARRGPGLHALPAADRPARRLRRRADGWPRARPARGARRRAHPAARAGRAAGRPRPERRRQAGGAPPRARAREAPALRARDAARPRRQVGRPDDPAPRAPPGAPREPPGRGHGDGMAARERRARRPAAGDHPRERGADPRLLAARAAAAAPLPRAPGGTSTAAGSSTACSSSSAAPRCAPCRHAACGPPGHDPACAPPRRRGGRGRGR